MASPHNYPFGTSTIFNEPSTSDKEDSYSRKFFELLKTPELVRVQHLPDVNTSSEDSFLNCGGEWGAPDLDDLLGGPLASHDWGDERVYFDSRMKENKVLEPVPNPPDPRSPSSVPHVVANVATTENESSHVSNTRSQSPTVPPVAPVASPVSEPDLSKEDEEDCDKEIMGMGAKYEFPPLPLPLPPRNANLRTAQYFDVRATSPAPSFLSAPSPSSSAALSPYSAASPAASTLSALSPPLSSEAPSPYSNRDFDSISSVDSGSESEGEEFCTDAEGEDASEPENDAPIDASPQPRVVLRLPARRGPTCASTSRPTTSPSPAYLFPSPTGTSESDHGDDEDMPSEGELRSKATEDADADYAPAPKRIRTNSGKAVPRPKGKAKGKAKAPSVDLSEDDASGDATHPRTGKKNDKKTKFFCQVEGCPERGKPFTYSGMSRHRKSHQPGYRNNVCPGGCGRKFAGRRDVIMKHLRESCPGDGNAGLARLAAEKRGGRR